MGEQFPKLDAKHREFIGRQRVFFTASAAPNARINISPRGVEAFRPRRQDRRLSGQDRQRQRDGRASQGRRAAHHHVLRLRRSAQHPEALRPRRSPATRECGIRRTPDKRIRRRGADRRAADDPTSHRPCEDLLRLWNASLCLPRERPSLDNWSRSQGEEGLEAYRRETNMVSIDGLPTGWLDEA